MKRLMNKPWMWTAAGLLLVALLIWYEGPLLAFDGHEPLASTSARWTLIMLVVLAVAAWHGWRLWRARRGNAQLAEAVSAPAQENGETAISAAEVAALGERMRAAMAVLRRAYPGWKMRGQYLYQLPWYMFVGAPGSGKTTALTQSGLQFPLAETMGTGAIAGVGGTRNCDWWFTDEAVLLDTAGRYTTQDSHAQADKAAWTGFLGLLKKHRSRRPVNGVILAISVADLLQQGEAARQTQAQAIRARIHELHQELGMAFPVYVMVTKSDLLAGFAEFFDPMGREERAQVWGMTFPLPADGSPAAALASYADEFDALERQLQARVLTRMQQERDLQRRALLYSFPQQFAGLGPVLGRFLHTVFEANRYEQAALLRGVYFTSGTQEGSPIDRVMAALAAAFGLGRKALPAGGGSGRSYFITRLMRDVIFREAGLAGINRAAERRRQLITWGALAGGSLLAILLAVGLTISYGRNQRLVAESATAATDLAKLAAATPAGGNVLAALPLLNAARALPAGYASQDDSIPWLNRMSLYQGEKLGDGAVAAYRRLLRTTLRPRIVANMEDALRRGDANNQDFLYETLRVYLMLGQHQHFDAASVQAWVEFDWRRSLPEANEAQRRQLLAHSAALLEAEDQADPVALDAALVAQVRLTLAGMPLPQRIYNRLKRQVSSGSLPEFSINGALRRDGSGVFARVSGAPLSRGVSGIYSVAGYRKVADQSGQAVADVAKDNWVLDRQESEAAAGIDQLKAAVMQLYFADYIRQWDNFLADVRLAPVSTLDQAARVTNTLSGADSPLRALLLAAARETTLEGARPDARGAVDQLVRDKLNAARRQLESVLGSADAAPPESPQHPVDQHFAALHRLAGGQSPAMLDQLLALIKDAALYFDAADSARRNGTPAPSADALVRLKRGGDGQPAPLPVLLQNIDAAGNVLAQNSERTRLNALWAGSGASFCRDAIAGRYPLVRGGTRDIAADDFGKFFAPGGLADDFFSKNLAPLVDMSGSQWHSRAGGSAALSQEALDQFQRAARLRDMFFGAGGRQPSMRFDLKVAAIDPALGQLTLTIDGQPLSGQQGAVSVLLPSGKGNGQIRFEASPALRGDWHTEGPWAWLHMMDRGLVTPLQGERFRLNFDLEGRQAVYELTASSVMNPFRRELLEQFRCPAAL
ncbi:type VI secretion system membrane subunit TssM [Duganella callida]|uniref:Type VI secretion system membrane subunit TssM n=1 Tax=Duganella callida TaxID=2561932 RepID=A0A4Y9SFY3_9BURK|nr:type VI secretion system membrane subunit TssM [Duganella callida]TFW20083.1 type VI secretion system membrane subunit TssM [Duganella callida]